MFSRVNSVRSFAVPVPFRRMSFFKGDQTPEMIRKAAEEMMKNPDAMKAAMSRLHEAVSGGGGLAGMMLRNGPLKTLMDRAGGAEQVANMLKDPAMMASVQAMMSNPEAMKRAAEAMKSQYPETNTESNTTVPEGTVVLEDKRKE